MSFIVSHATGVRKVLSQTPRKRWSSRKLAVTQARHRKNSSSGLTVLRNSQEETTVGFFPVLCNAQMSLTPAPARKKADHEHMGAVDKWFSALLPQNTTLLLKSSPSFY